MDPRLRASIILIVAGLGLASLGFALRPVSQGEEGVVALRGPAAAEYDAESDTTRAAFYLGHWHGGPAFTLEGDARDLVAKRRVYLKADASDWALEPISPIPVEGGPDPVEEAYAGPFTPATPGPRLAPLVVAPLLVGTGIGYSLRSWGPRAPLAMVLSSTVGVPLGVLGATMGEGGLLVLGLAGVLGIGSLALLITRRTRLVGVALAFAAAAAVWTLLMVSPWFPSAPAV